MEPINIFDSLTDWVLDHLKILVNVCLGAVFLFSIFGYGFIKTKQNIPDNSATLFINAPDGERLAQIIVIHPVSVYPNKDFPITVRYLPEEKIDYKNILKIEVIENDPELIKIAKPFSKKVALKYSARDDYQSTVTVFNVPGSVKKVTLTLKLNGTSSVTNLPIEIPVNHFSPELGLVSAITTILLAIAANFGKKISEKLFLLIEE